MNKKKIIYSFLLIFNYQSYSSEKQPTTLYCHGLNSSAQRIKKLQKASVIQEPAQSFNFDHHKKDIGQIHDITKLKEQIRPDENYILYGHSRGGATILSYLAQNNPTNIQAIVIDAAPADVIDRVDEIQYEVGACIFRTRPHKEWIVRQLYPGYPKDSRPPVETIADIKNKELPVFLVHSENDEIVNVRAAWKIYKAFQQAQFSHAYICTLQHGGHSGNAREADSHTYKSALHSVYKKHGFKHDAHQAILDDLSHLQPSVNEADTQIKLQETKLLDKYHQRHARNLLIGINTAFILASMARYK